MPLLLVFLCALQDDKVVAGRGDRTPLRVTLSGDVEFSFAYRDRTVEDARAALNGVPAPADTGVLWPGRATTRLDVEIDKQYSAAIELGTRPYDNGVDLSWGSDPAATRAQVLKAYLGAEDFIIANLSARIGLQEFSYRLRPEGEPFFFDVSESSSFYSGATTFVRTTADRNMLSPVGLTLRYDIAEYMSMEFAWGLAVDGGPPDASESFGILYLDGLLSERLSYFLLGCMVAGSGHDRNVWTVGLGMDFYPTKSRAVELFGEGYFQFGTLTTNVDKRAWAGQAGVHVYLPAGWIEGAVAYRSGDKDPTDDRDEGFQSYSHVRQFLILEDPAFGLDIRTNVRSLRFSGGVSTTLWKPFEARADLGVFRVDQDLRSAAGALLSASNSLGTEIDVTLKWLTSPALALSIRAGALVGASAIDDLAGQSHTYIFTSGADLRF